MGYTAIPTVTTGLFVDATWMNTYLRDNLAYLLNPNRFALRGVYNISVTGTSWATTSLSQPLTTYGGPLIMMLGGLFYISSGSYTLSLAFNLDGARYEIVTTNIPTGGYSNYRTFPIVLSPGAGAHTCSIDAKVSGGTGTLEGTTENPLFFYGIGL